MLCSSPTIQRRSCYSSRFCAEYFRHRRRNKAAWKQRLRPCFLSGLTDSLKFECFSVLDSKLRTPERTFARTDEDACSHYWVMRFDSFKKRKEAHHQFAILSGLSISQSRQPRDIEHHRHPQQGCQHTIESFFTSHFQDRARKGEVSLVILICI